MACMAVTERYGETVLSPEWGNESARLTAIAEVADGTTRGVLRELGLRPDADCLEVGAGLGTVATWLAGQVPQGSVLATDVDTRWLVALAGGNLRVEQHDVVHDPLPAGAFDLIHARFVLEHLPERDAVLAKLCRSLRPGGHLVVESIVGFPLAMASNKDFREAMEAIAATLAVTIGTDTDWAGTFPEPLERHGLTEVAAGVHVPTTGGGNASARCWSFTLAQLRPAIARHRPGALAAVDEALRLLERPDFVDYAFGTAITSGRR
jgi:SAM-dependent methyltransferase